MEQKQVGKRSPWKIALTLIGVLLGAYAVGYLIGRLGAQIF